MLTNERVQRLIDTDRDALVELMALTRRIRLDLVDGFDNAGDITVDNLLESVAQEIVCDGLNDTYWKDALAAWNNEMRPLLVMPQPKPCNDVVTDHARAMWQYW